MALTIYGDFTNPLSWVASTRTDALVGAGTNVQWRAVAGRHTLTVTSVPADRQLTNLVDEVGHWHDTTALSGEPKYRAAPALHPNPIPAASAYAEAVGAGVSDHVRYLLFDSYWRRGQDIGTPDILRHLLVLPMLRGHSPSDVIEHEGYAVSIGGSPVTTAAWRLGRGWQQEYESLAQSELPVVVDGERVRCGFEALDYLGALVRDAEATFPAGNPYPLPPMPVSAQWLSIGRPGRRPTWWEESPTASALSR